MNQPIYNQQQQQQQPSIFTTDNSNFPNQDNFFIYSQQLKKQKCKNGFIQCCCIGGLVTGMNLLTFYIGYYYGINHYHDNDGSF